MSPNMPSLMLRQLNTAARYPFGRSAMMTGQTHGFIWMQIQGSCGQSEHGFGEFLILCGCYISWIMTAEMISIIGGCGCVQLLRAYLQSAGLCLSSNVFTCVGAE